MAKCKYGRSKRWPFRCRKRRPLSAERRRRGGFYPDVLMFIRGARRATKCGTKQRKEVAGRVLNYLQAQNVLEVNNGLSDARADRRKASLRRALKLLHSQLVRPCQKRRKRPGSARRVTGGPELLRDTAPARADRRQAIAAAAARAR